MARPLRLLQPDGIYHVTSRGNGGTRLFVDDEERVILLAHFARAVRRFGWRCWAYCLMPTHFHLLLQTPVPNLSRGMQNLKSGFARDRNRRRGKPGHVFDGRYGAKLVQSENYLFAVFRYIAQNPVRDGYCQRPEQWRWSSHRALAGLERGPNFLDVASALVWFDDTDPHVAREHYRALAAEPLDDLPSNGAVIGDDAFARLHLPAESPSSEIAVAEWGPGRPPLAVLLGAGLSGEAVAVAYRRHGYTLAQIASHAGVHVATVSRRLSAHERAMRDCKI